MNAKYYKLVVTNRKARFNYEIKEDIEAGIVLNGTEVKSIRLGKVSLKDSYANFNKNKELFLYNLYIAPYEQSSHFLTPPERPRKLLLKKQQLKRLYGKVAERGLALVPLKIYFSGSHVKVLLGLGRGKTHGDKRNVIKERDMKRQVARDLKYGK